MRKLKRRPYPGGPQHVEPDMCGKLPSGEICCLDPGHKGGHEKLHFERILTNYQDPLIDAIAELLFWFEHDASSWDETVFPNVRKDFLKRAEMVIETFQKEA